MRRPSDEVGLRSLALAPPRADSCKPLGAPFSVSPLADVVSPLADGLASGYGSHYGARAASAAGPEEDTAEGVAAVPLRLQPAARPAPVVGSVQCASFLLCSSADADHIQSHTPEF